MRVVASGFLADPWGIWRPGWHHRARARGGFRIGSIVSAAGDCPSAASRGGLTASSRPRRVCGPPERLADRADPHGAPARLASTPRASCEALASLLAPRPRAAYAPAFTRRPMAGKPRSALATTSRTTRPEDRAPTRAPGMWRPLDAAAPPDPRVRAPTLGLRPTAPE